MHEKYEGPASRQKKLLVKELKWQEEQVVQVV